MLKWVPKTERFHFLPTSVLLIPTTQPNWWCKSCVFSPQTAPAFSNFCLRRKRTTPMKTKYTVLSTLTWICIGIGWGREIISLYLRLFSWSRSFGCWEVCQFNRLLIVHVWRPWTWCLCPNAVHKYLHARFGTGLVECELATAPWVCSWKCYFNITKADIQNVRLWT